MSRRHRTLLEFQREFPNEDACANFLIRRRWPDGFFCPGCGSVRSGRLRSRSHTFECLDCGRQTSITAGTVMHKTKLSLLVWFWAAHLVATHSNGISALQLMTQIGTTYKTAWLLLQKLRAAMIAPDREKLRGLVEVDQAEIPFRESDAPFDDTRARKIIIIAAVEMVDRSTGVRPPTDFNRQYRNTRAGRVRLAAIPDQTRGTIHAFVRANIEPGSTLLTDGHDSFLGLSEPTDPERYEHDQRVIGLAAAHIWLPWVHRVFSLLKRWGLGTYHGFRRSHIDIYLNEFVFRFNRRFYRHIAFETILGLAALHPPWNYVAITGNQNPRPNLPPVRRRPRRRKTPLGMRPDGPPRTRLSGGDPAAEP